MKSLELEKLERAWNEYDGSYTVSMKHGFDLFLRAGCEYSRKRFIYKIAEENELNYLKTLELENSICFDIGANIGYWAKYLLKISQVKELHCFEPDKQTCEILGKNISDYNNVILNQSAVSDSNNDLMLYIDPDHSGDNRPQFTKDRDSILVPCCTLDSYVEEHNIKQIDFIKIDIQGGEISALIGAACVIRKFKPLILIEVAAEFDKESQVGINDYILQMVEALNYRVYIVEDNLPKYLKKAQLKNIHGNVFLSPR